MSINLKNKQEIVKKFGKDAKDTGSSAVQVAMMTQKITELTEHLKSNKKDFATKRGLLMMVGRRKRLLSFMKEEGFMVPHILKTFPNGHSILTRKKSRRSL